MKAITYTAFGMFYLICFFLIVKSITPTYKKGLEQSLQIKGQVIGR